jgi:hypothetical protein
MATVDRLCVQAGRLYWVQLETVRIKVRAVEPLTSGLWWHCAGPLDTELLVPVDCFCEEYLDGQTAG